MVQPHDLVVWRRIACTPDIAAESACEAYGIAQPSRFVESVLFSQACSTSVSEPENNSSAGRSGPVRPSSVISMIRRAITKLMAMALWSRSAVLCCRASMRQALFSRRCQSSMRQRRQYQRKHSWASLLVEQFVEVRLAVHHDHLERVWRCDQKCSSVLLVTGRARSWRGGGKIWADACKAARGQRKGVSHHLQ